MTGRGGGRREDPAVPRWTRRALLAVALAAASSLLLAACDAGTTRAVGAPPQSGAGSAVLEWDPVVSARLAGYRIHYGTASGSYSRAADVPAGSTTHTLQGLAGGTRWYFVVTAVDASGQESGPSNEVEKDVP